MIYMVIGFFEFIEDPTVVQAIDPEFKLQSGDFSNSSSLSSKSNLFYNSLPANPSNINVINEYS